MATQPTAPDNTPHVLPGMPAAPEQSKEPATLPGQPPAAPVPQEGVAQPTKDQKKYWERVLSSMGLGMERGAANNRVSQTDRRRRVIPVGDSSALDKIPSTRRGRRVRPPGHGPDTD